MANLEPRGQSFLVHGRFLFYLCLEVLVYALYKTYYFCIISQGDGLGEVWYILGANHMPDTGDWMQYEPLAPHRYWSFYVREKQSM